MAIPELRLPDGSIAGACVECGAGGSWPPDLSDRVCAVCQSMTCYRHCPKCKTYVILPPKLTGPKVKSWKCLTCGKTATRQKWLPGTIGEVGRLNHDIEVLYQRLGVPLADAESDPDRRRIDGSLLNVTGTSGMATGGVTIFFDRSLATLMIGDTSNPIVIPYESLRGLRFAGRGEIVSKSGGGWWGGGFGITGMAAGLATATILNALTTRKKASIESIVSFEWTDGSITMLNTKFLPAQLGVFLAPALRRMESAVKAAQPQAAQSAAVSAAQPHQGDDIVAGLASLAALRDSGALTEAEFQAAKSRILG